ncbi:MAG: 30S ribosome-binding factor RbfA [Candidatus Competibacteraceae bacterium]|nr:30S ribosome-binding factor RbfA [Candidatus Competibacteraceae bacterium]
MPREFSRTRRVGEQIRRELAELIREDIRDPRISMVSITAVDVSRDFAYAKVFVTALVESEERQEMVDILNQSSPRLRGELGRRMHIRTVPKLDFRYDESVERGARLSSLIDRAVAQDAQRHRHGDDEDPEQ